MSSAPFFSAASASDDPSAAVSASAPKFNDLMRAAHSDDVEWIEDWGDEFDPLERFESGPTALMIAADFGHARCVELLLRRTPEEQCRQLWGPGQGLEAIDMAIRAGRSECARLLSPFSTGPEADAKLLTAAARAGFPEVLAALLPGRDANARTERGESALLAAAASTAGHGATECVRLLLAQPGIRTAMDGPDDYRTAKAAALFAAIKADNLQSMRALSPFFDLNAFENVYSSSGRWGGRMTPLMWAIEHSVSCAEFLLYNLPISAFLQKTPGPVDIGLGAFGANTTALDIAIRSQPPLADKMGVEMLRAGLPFQSQASEKFPASAALREALDLRHAITPVADKSSAGDRPANGALPPANLGEFAAANAQARTSGAESGAAESPRTRRI